MTAAKKALDAADAAIAATFPRPGTWRWEARPGDKTVYLGTHAFEAMTFRRWGMGGAQPVFMTRNNGLSLLRDASDFLAAIPGREHHEWAKRIDHPVANVIALGVNLLGPLAAVARAAMAVWDGVCTKGCVEEDHGSMRDLVAALDALEAAAAAQGFSPPQKTDYGPPDAAAASLLGQIAGASVAVDRQKGGAT